MKTKTTRSKIPRIFTVILVFRYHHSSSPWTYRTCVKRRKNQNETKKPRKHAEETQNETKTDHKFSATVHRTARGLFQAVLLWLDPRGPCAAPVSRILGRIRAARARKTTGGACLVSDAPRSRQGRKDTLPCSPRLPLLIAGNAPRRRWNYGRRSASVGSATTLGRAANSRTETINQVAKKKPKNNNQSN